MTLRQLDHSYPRSARWLAFGFLLGTYLLVGACADDSSSNDDGGETVGDGDPGDGDPGDGDPGDGDPGPSCGDGVLDDGETCDDGNSTNLDGCETDCQPSVVEALASGWGFTCVSFGAAVRCWGVNDDGQLGIGTSQEWTDEPPPPLAEVGGDVVALDCGIEHSCVITTDGRLRCWGKGFSGQLGYANRDDVGDEPGEMPPPIVHVGGTPVLAGLGGAHTCVVLDNGETRCFGSNGFGQLGYGHTNEVGVEPGEMPPPPVNVGGTPIQLSLGHRHTCALLDTGKVRCWGSNDFGQLGLGHVENIGDDPGEMPPPDINLGSAIVVEIGAGEARNCARFDDGTARCWGTGPLGYGTAGAWVGDEPGDMPPPVLDLSDSVIGLRVGYGQTCVLLTGGTVSCWGWGMSGQLGYGDTLDIGDEPGEMPPPNVDIGGPATMLGLGVLHSCALMETNEVRCWGEGDGSGQSEAIGDEPGEMPPPPVTLY